MACSIFDFASVAPNHPSPGVHAPRCGHAALWLRTGLPLCNLMPRRSRCLVLQAPPTCCTANLLPPPSCCRGCAGVVSVWDVSTGALLNEFEAHSKRIWSVDFCEADPTLLASGSDDCAVKFWSTNCASSVAQVGGLGARGGQDCGKIRLPLPWGLLRRPVCCTCMLVGFTSTALLPLPALPPPSLPCPALPLLSFPQVETRANVCAVRWRPGSCHELAVGSADHSVYLYDLRHTAQPLRTFQGHRCAGQARGSRLGLLIEGPSRMRG